MSLKKNQIFETTIENLSSDGSGVAHVEGQAVFVPGAAPGDVIRCRIVKALKSYAFGRIDAILAPGPGRVAPDCAVCTPCGGCGLRHLSYATECEAKTGFVRDAFARLGGFDVSSFEFSPVLALTDHTAHYRNTERCLCINGNKSKIRDMKCIHPDDLLPCNGSCIRNIIGVSLRDNGLFLLIHRNDSVRHQRSRRKLISDDCSFPRLTLRKIFIVDDRPDRNPRFHAAA